jgi:hypothetical protein
VSAGQPWEVWDSESGNLVFAGTETEAVAEAERLQAAGARGISVGPEDDSRVQFAVGESAFAEMVRLGQEIDNSPAADI